MHTMAEATAAASHSQPKPIPRPNKNSTAAQQPPTSIAIPSATPFQQHGRLALETLSPVNKNGSFEFDRIIKAGEVLKRTRKTKVRGLGPARLTQCGGEKEGEADG